MPQPQPIFRRCGLAAADFVLVAASYVTAACLMGADPYLLLLYEGLSTAIAVTACVFVMAMSFQGLYIAVRLRSRVELTLRLSTVTGVAFLAQAIIQYLHGGFAIPFAIMLPGSFLAWLALLCWRLLYFSLVARSFGQERVLLVGATPRNREIGAGIVNQPEIGMAVLGYLDESLEPGTLLEGGKVLAPLDSLPEIWQAMRPDRVVADLPGGDCSLPSGLVKRAVAAGVIVERPAILYEALFGRVPVSEQQAADALFSGERERARVAVQSIYNNLLGLAALVTFAPLMVLIGILIKATSRGPACERQSIMGWGLLPFTLYRFRCTTADEGRRTTPVGRWLRALHLDGLPQFFNVLRGEMSLVGPRPVRTDELNLILASLPGYRQRYSIKPGLVGWSQIKAEPGPLEAAVELEYDLYYARHFSLALDCSIILHVLKPAFSRSFRH